MRVFLLDLWLDLREKKLAPLALLLILAIVAVPVVLANDEKTPAPPPATATATTASAAPVIQSGPDEGPTESKLQTFSPRDPFEPTGSSGGTSAGTTTAGTGGTTGTGTTPATTPPTGGGGATTGSGPTTGTGTPGTGTNGTGNTTGETRTTLFTYTVDLRFGEGGAMKAYKDVQRLDLIPDQADPKIVFLGVTTTAKTAVFLVSQDVGVDTGGKCRPSADQCSFLYLRPDDEHDEALLTDADGTVYHLRLLKIHRVTVSSSNGSTTGSGNSGSGNSKSDSNRSPAFTGQAKRQDSANDATVPGESTPPGEPEKRSSFQQFFADSASDSTSEK